MASIISRLNYKNAALKRKLYSNAIRLKGFDVKCIRVSVTEDKYANKDFVIHDHGTIEMVIDLPSKDVMLGNSSRTNNTFYQNFQSIYDVIPIFGYTQMTAEAQLEHDDIIIFKYILSPHIENETQEAFIQTLQVSNVLGKFSNTLLYKKYVLAPYTFNVQEYPAIQTLIENYKIEPIIIS